jgi:hypothetical protein
MDRWNTKILFIKNALSEILLSTRQQAGTNASAQPSPSAVGASSEPQEAVVPDATSSSSADSTPMYLAELQLMREMGLNYTKLYSPAKPESSFTVASTRALLFKATTLEKSISSTLALSSTELSYLILLAAAVPFFFLEVVAHPALMEPSFSSFAL